MALFTVSPPEYYTGGIVMMTNGKYYELDYVTDVLEKYEKEKEKDMSMMMNNEQYKEFLETVEKIRKSTLLVYQYEKSSKCSWAGGEIKSIKDLLDNMGIEKVIFNENATIVCLTTGEKGVAVRSQDDHFDPVIGFSVAYTIAKGTKGNKSRLKELVNKMYEKQVRKEKF